MFALSLVSALLTVACLLIATTITATTPTPQITRAEARAYGVPTGWGAVLRALEPTPAPTPAPTMRLAPIVARTMCAPRVAHMPIHRVDADACTRPTIVPTGDDHTADTSAPAMPYIVDFYTCGATHGAKVLTADNRIVSILVKGLAKLTDPQARIDCACDYYMANC